MKKKRAMLNFAGIIFICLLLVALSLFSFAIPGSDYDYMGFLQAIDLGIEYESGTILTFSVKNNTTNTAGAGEGISAHAVRIENLLKSSNYDVVVYPVGSSNIVVELKKEYVSDGVEMIINANNSLTMTKESKTDNPSATVYFNGENITGVSSMQNPNYTTGSTTTSPYGVYIEFNEQGQADFAALTREIVNSGSGSIYIYIGDVVFQQLSVSQEINQSYVFISGNSSDSNMSNAKNAAIYAAKINASRFNYSFVQTGENIITAENAVLTTIMSAILLGVVVIGTVLYLSRKFKKLGLVSAFSLIVGLIFQVILLQAVPIVTLSSPAFIISVLMYVLGFTMVHHMLSKMAEEYSVGKKIHASLKFGYLKTYPLVIEIFSSVLLSGILFYIFGSTPVRYFAISMIIGTAIYGFCTLLVNKLFTKMYLNINPARAKDYGFKREVNVNELE